MKGSTKYAVLAFAAVFACAVDLVAQTPATPPGGSAPATSDGRVQEAEGAAADCKGKKGEERQVALERAAKLWEGVLADFAESEPEVGVRAAWEAGELWRRKGDLDGADRCYTRALALDQGRYRERATYARADVARRQQRFDDAIALYGEVVGMRPDSARAHRSRLRIGRCLEAKNDREGALQTYRDALDAVAATPRRAVDAGNALARLLVRMDDLDGAAAAIERVESIAKPVLDAGGKEGQRLQKALDGMSARRALQRARDDREGAGDDAEELDEDQRSGQ